jgi:hypothetical protein
MEYYLVEISGTFRYEEWKNPPCLFSNYDKAKEYMDRQVNTYLNDNKIDKSNTELEIEESCDYFCIYKEEYYDEEHFEAMLTTLILDKEWR